jgi:type I restriction enzyme S subunit
MTPEVKERIEQIRHGNVPEGYQDTAVGIIPNDWHMGTVRECIKEYKLLSNDIEHVPVYSSSRRGLIPQSDYYDQREASETNLGYKVVPNGYVTYRHMSDDDVFHFNINKTGGEILVSSEYPVFTASDKGRLGFLIPALNGTARFRYFCKTQKLGGTRTRLYLENLKKYSLALAPRDEQDKIAEILAAQDKQIELKEKLLAEKQRQKKYMMQQLLTGKKRLPGFDGEWQNCRLHQIVKRIRRKNTVGNENVLTISAQYGLINQSEFFNKEIASEDKSNYYLLNRSDFAYNKSYSSGYPFGAIKRLTRYDMGIVSPLYICFEIVGENVSLEYMEQYFEAGLMNREIQAFAQEGARNHGLLNIAVDDFFNSKLVLPSIEEQQAIAAILTAADREIELLRQDLEQEKQKKKALMQLLLTGVVRV